MLLLFSRADAQCSALERAADVGRYDVDVARSTDAAMQSYVGRQHDVVVVDTSSDSTIDAESFARSLQLSSEKISRRRPSFKSRSRTEINWNYLFSLKLSDTFDGYDAKILCSLQKVKVNWLRLFVWERGHIALLSGLQLYVWMYVCLLFSVHRARCISEIKKWNKILFRFSRPPAAFFYFGFISDIRALYSEIKTETKHWNSLKQLLLLSCFRTWKTCFSLIHIIFNM